MTSSGTASENRCLSAVFLLQPPLEPASLRLYLQVSETKWRCYTWAGPGPECPEPFPTSRDSEPLASPLTPWKRSLNRKRNYQCCSTPKPSFPIFFLLQFRGVIMGGCAKYFPKGTSFLGVLTPSPWGENSAEGSGRRWRGS